MSVVPLFFPKLVNSPGWRCEGLMWMPTGFMSGYAQQFQCHRSCFFLVPEKSPGLQSLCATAVVLCTAAGLYAGKLAHGCYLLIIRIQTRAQLGSNPWFSINVSFFCTERTRGTRSTWNMYSWVLLRFSKNKIIKGNPSPLDPEATKSCTWVCGWGDKTIRIQILLHCLKRFFLFMGHSYSTRLWPHNHNWAALHLFQIAMIMAGKRQAIFQVCSVSHRLFWVW